MTNEKQLRILKEEPVEVWNKWREENPDLEINFSNANLFDANLFDANLSNANLSNANLSDANLSNANLSNANLSNANLSDAYLFDANLSNANLNNANLNNAYLSNANLSNANLNNANLNNANLNYANLTIVKALATNFSSTILTGAYIKDWNINSKTKLDNVICDYIYLKLELNIEKQEYKFLERRPCDLNRNFKPGEFTKLIGKFVETVDLIFSDGIDWQTFLTAFQELQIESESSELSVQAIEKKQDDPFVIRVNIPADANKEKIELSFWSKYQLLLEAKDREIKLLSKQTEVIRRDNTRLLGVIETMVEKENTKYDLHSTYIGNLADQGTI